MTDKIVFLGNCLYPRFKGANYSGATFGCWGVSPTINTQGGGNRQPYILTYGKERTDKVQIQRGRLDTSLRQHQEHQYLGVADMEPEGRVPGADNNPPPLVIAYETAEQAPLVPSAVTAGDVADGIRHDKADRPYAKQPMPGDNDLPVGVQQRSDNL